MKNKIKLNAVIYSLPNFVTAICSIISLPFLTQELDLNEFGYFFLCSIIVNLFGAFTSLGSSFGMARYFHRQSVKKQKVFISSIFFLSILIGFIICVVLYFFWDFFLAIFIPEIIEVKTNQMFIIFFCILIYGNQLFVSEILTLTSKPFLFFLSIATPSIIGALVNISLITHYSFGVDTLFYALFASSLINFTFILIIMSKYIKFWPNINLLKQILKEYKIIVANIFENFCFFIERNLITRFLGIELFALFSHSKNYERTMVNINTGIYRSVYFLALEEFKKNKSFSYCEKSIEYSLLFIFFFSSFFYTIGYDFIALISNNKFSDASYFVGLWGLIFFYKGTNIMYTVIILIKGNPKTYANIIYYDKVSLIILLLGLLPFFGLTGIVISYSVSAFILKIYFFVSAKKLSRFPNIEIRITKVFLISLLTFIISFNFGNDPYSRATFFCLFYLFGFFIFRKRLFDLIRELMASLKRIYS